MYKVLNRSQDHVENNFKPNALKRGLQEAIRYSIDHPECAEIKFNPYHDKLGRFTFAENDQTGSGRNNNTGRAASKNKPSGLGVLLSPEQRQIVRDNLKRLFPSLTDREIDNLQSDASNNPFAIYESRDIKDIRVVGDKAHGYYAEMTEKQYKAIERTLSVIKSVESKKALAELYKAKKNGKIRIKPKK